MRSFLVYSLLRLVIFLACFGVLFVLFGAQVSPSWLVALPALLLTSGLSWLLLRKRGADAGMAMTSGVQAMRHRLDAASRKEDVDPVARGGQAEQVSQVEEIDQAEQIDQVDQAPDRRS
ncbi:DUF4229 domain-containing protein [Actinopolymorpha pittospori]|uniref:DUF4229 domain-containing protein n=1 Tax=Actinopolymorpha pittospori TaxID=648752 RepID=A0A927MY34_9ACTN|nr:hypothetical protein [Actinopolymorpha pittospori]